jgi:hypothetical protein
MRQKKAEDVNLAIAAGLALATSWLAIGLMSLLTRLPRLCGTPELAFVARAVVGTEK